MTTPEFLCAGDMLIRKGEKGDRMFFLESGTMIVSLEDPAMWGMSEKEREKLGRKASMDDVEFGPARRESMDMETGAKGLWDERDPAKMYPDMPSKADWNVKIATMRGTPENTSSTRSGSMQ